MVHLWFSWGSVLCCLLACGSWVVGRFGRSNQTLQRWMRGKQHHNWGMYALGCGLVHGLLTIGLLGIGTMPSAMITGSLLLVPMVVLCKGKRVGKINWLTQHRYLSLCLVVMMLVHLAVV